MKEYKVKFYARGCYLQTVHIFANSKVDAILNVRKENDVVEMIYCKEVRK